MRLPTDLILGGYMTNDFMVTHGLQEEPIAFDVRFSRCFHLLRFVACRILGGPERVHHAIENCWRTASRNPPRFKYEGAFRGWLLRVLIDEALAIRQKEAKLGVETLPQFVPAEEDWKLADCCLE
jgi:DNA-directed RNA polymerase specialized sigma24 family protein